jgi:hypothetical protein
MDNYKYFSDVLKNGYFTETPCQFCGSSEHCLEGSFFDWDDNLVSICLNCFDKRKVSVDIPSYTANRPIVILNPRYRWTKTQFSYFFILFFYNSVCYIARNIYTYFSFIKAIETYRYKIVISVKKRSFKTMFRTSTKLTWCFCEVSIL